MCVHHYVVTNMNSTILNIKHAIGWWCVVLGRYNSELMGVCVRRRCFCPSFCMRCIPQTSINMSSITLASLGLWSAQNTMCVLCHPVSFWLSPQNLRAGFDFYMHHHIPLLLINSTIIVGIVSALFLDMAQKTRKELDHMVGNLDILSNCFSAPNIPHPLWQEHETYIL